MSEPFLGEIKMFGFNFNPEGWLNCDGAVLPINQNQALFSLLGTIYGGDGRTTFAIPDLRGRVPVHTGTGAGLEPRTQGEHGGSEESSHIQSHVHGLSTGSVASTDVVGDQPSPGGHILSTANDGENNFSSARASGTSGALSGNTTITGSPAGNDNNMPPFLTIRFCIATVGIFPSRN